jgi:tRNA-modifying protein YgfZ
MPFMNSRITLCPLTDFAILGIEGPESHKFLQGQATCDTAQVTLSASRLGAHCNPKGRMISNFRAFNLSEQTLGLRLHRDLLPVLQQSLAKYIVFSKAELVDFSDQYQVTGLYGDDLFTQLDSLLDIQLKENNQAATNTHGSFIRLDDNRAECWLSPEQVQQLKNTLGDTLLEGSQDDWLLSSIRAGVGEVYPQTQNEWIPQMLNYQADAINGVSFEKGCYTGQEIVARMQYLGKLKRHMYRFSCTQRPTPGQELYSKAAKQSIGEVVMAGQVGDIIECLAAVTTAATEANDVYLDTDKTVSLDNLPLPYPLTTAINT